jgi:phosphate/sulfate permease
MHTLRNTTVMAVASFFAILALAMLVDASLTDASAQTVFTQLENKSRDIFYNARTIILILCALAIIVTMATAISGRFPISKALAIVGAIIVIGVASQVVTYFAGTTQANSGGSTIPSLTDTSQ